MADILFVLAVIAIFIPIAKWLAYDEDSKNEPPHSFDRFS
jgi:hypothetical protein